MAMPSSDTDELAKFGYKQELDRSLGLFSSFAAGFSYISIMTGVFELFFFGFASGGPAFIWTWPAVFAGQFLVALCFAELAGQYPLAGSVYQWSKQIARPFTSFFGGWILSLGAIVTLAAVAVAYQVVAPQISAAFQIIGGPSDIGLVSTPDGAKNALLLAAGLVVFTTLINLVAAHIRRGPGVVFDTFGTGATYPCGYFGAFLVAGLLSAYVMYGFDTAGSLAEETLDPRRHAPPAIIRALAAAGLAGLLVILLGEMSVPDIHAKALGTSGLPYLVKATLGGTIGNVFLIDSLIAITVCSLAVHAGGIRMIFTMGRDGRLPFASAIAKVHGKSKTPLIPSIVIGLLTILLLVLNVGNQRAFFVLTSVAIIMFYIAYMCVTGPLLIARLRGKWPPPAGPVESVWVVRSGSAEIIHHGRVLDLLGPGELLGHASMISGLPTGFEARAAEDTVCYRISADVIRPLLARPDVLRFVARSIVARSNAEGTVAVAPAEPVSDPVQSRVGTLIRQPPLLCQGSEPIREAARRMTEQSASAVLVPHGHSFGIVTDRDLRTRVIAAGLSPGEPVSAIMTEPAYTVTAGRLGGDVLLDMLERNVHHIPVLSPAGQVLGVVDDGDLVAAEGRKPLLLRRAIALAESPADLTVAAAGLDPVTIALHDARVTAEHLTAVRSVVLDALTRRLVELAVRDAGPPPVPFTWFALGSLARREAAPSSDVDSALAWGDDASGAEAREVADYLGRVTQAVDEGLRACGMSPDAHGASAANPIFARSLASWHRAARSLSEDPTQEKALILVSVLADSRPVWSTSGAPGGGLWEGQPNPDLLRLLARFALSFRPPTGFLRDFVVEHSGERRGQLDIKHGGMIPIVDLARWAGMAAGVASASTRERLRAAEAAGTMDSAEAQTLTEAFGFIFSLRLDHQVEQLRRGEEPDDFIDPKTLNPLARSYLREAFRAVASVQANLSAELSLGVRWG